MYSSLASVGGGSGLEYHPLRLKTLTLTSTIRRLSMSGSRSFTRFDGVARLEECPGQNDKKSTKLNLRARGFIVFRGKPCQTLKNKVLKRVFSEDYDSNQFNTMFNPHGCFILRWNKILLAACLVSVFVDPLFLYLPGTRESACIHASKPLKILLTILRSLADVLYAFQIFVHFHTAYVAPSSHVFGRGELIIDPSKIASRYLSTGFWLEFLAALPFPQFLVWAVIPNLSPSTSANTWNLVRLSSMLQYLPRFFMIFPLTSQIVKATGAMTETAWAGAAYNLSLYMLVSHVLGASWYLLAFSRAVACWKELCRLQSPVCQFRYLHCQGFVSSRNSWFQSSNITVLCNPKSNFYQFGIYAEAVDNGISSLPFLRKYFYSFWWGLKNLSSLGQNLDPGPFVGEICFAILVAVLGLVLFGLLIGNMHSYLQATRARLEEWRIRRNDTEQWMQHRQLPLHLRRCIRRYDEYKWIATQGVDEQALLSGLPLGLRRGIKRHLCLDLVRRVPLFDQMDERMLEAICELLRPMLYTSGTYLFRELDPVDEMSFIIRGHLNSYTTGGGRAGFFDSCQLGPGDFCGEELLSWVLDPRMAVPTTLPSSTRTVKAVTEVEGFALSVNDLQFVAAQFRMLHSRRLRYKFRFYSHQWRMWAACSIQAAWRRHHRGRAAPGRLMAAMANSKDAVGGRYLLKGIKKNCFLMLEEHDQEN
ncbi:Putative cyclic nucleotide-gated ion channel 15 [Apostasia shenzhenica]|uniref:Cyclic nucleotide-gated ion channel 15 n=1 Tax=Apostasia shenzhenica TaxID=1088818 RepID=A0A2I0A966_9ASPA|nr:Putative cyclic nucleotide-gated ion channel 15 [Apostasia shenzhenica]